MRGIAIVGHGLKKTETSHQREGHHIVIYKFTPYILGLTSFKQHFSHRLCIAYRDGEEKLHCKLTASAQYESASKVESDGAATLCVQWRAFFCR